MSFSWYLFHYVLEKYSREHNEYENFYNHIKAKTTYYLERQKCGYGMLKGTQTFEWFLEPQKV